MATCWWHWSTRHNTKAFFVREKLAAESPRRDGVNRRSENDRGEDSAKSTDRSPARHRAFQRTLPPPAAHGEGADRCGPSRQSTQTKPNPTHRASHPLHYGHSLFANAHATRVHAEQYKKSPYTTSASRAAAGGGGGVVVAAAATLLPPSSCSSSSPRLSALPRARPDPGGMGAGALGVVAMVAAAVVVAMAGANSEGDALSALRRSLRDPGGVLQSWDPTLVNPCTWFHVTCDRDNRVTRLWATLSLPPSPRAALYCTRRLELGTFGCLGELDREASRVWMSSRFRCGRVDLED